MIVCETNHLPLLVDMKYILCLLLIMLPMGVAAQVPAIAPEVSYTNPEGVTLYGSYPDDMNLQEPQNAPLRALFRSNPQDYAGWNVNYDWAVYLDTTSTERNFEMVVHRYDEDLEYTFVQKGRYRVRVRATFTRDGETVVCPSEDMDSVCFTFEINRSRLRFPNTFTPNGDQINDTLRAKEFQSIVEFRAIVFNRWGKRLYSWNDVNGGWDGKVGGSYVNDGAYYLVVNAKGADGHVYRIKKTINVLTSKMDDGSTDTDGGDAP